MEPIKASSVSAVSAASDWSPAKRIAFRFVFAYLVLYNFPFPLDAIPWLGPILTQPVADLWDAVVPWAGKHFLHIDVLVRRNGSGDKTYNYVQVLCYLVIALAATAVWTLVDRYRGRKHADYSRLSEGLRTYVRFSLGAAMISYGAYKAIPSQFARPGLDQLIQPFGEASPMGILWTLMGASTAYTVFSGLAEMAGGLLLMARRTTLLGALVSIGVLVNVVMLNFSYDVPVKLYSSHLLAMACFLLLPDLRRLANVLLLNRAAEPITPDPSRSPLTTGRLRRAAPVLLTVLVAAYTGHALYKSYDSSKEYGNLSPKPPLYGIWNVDELEVDGVARPPLLTDATRWRRMVVSYPGEISVQLMDSTSAYYSLYLGKRRLALGKFDDPHWKSSFSYRELAPGLLALEGVLDGKRTRMRMRRMPEAAFTLTSRGFHWINESPFNH